MHLGNNHFLSIVFALQALGLPLLLPLLSYFYCWDYAAVGLLG